MEGARMKLTAIHKRRLNKLADFLDKQVSKLPKRRFSMISYSNMAIDREGRTLFREKLEPSCGTSACACGFATAIFRDLKLEYSSSWEYTNLINIKTGEVNDQAVEDFFGVQGGTEFEHVFGCDKKRTPKQEAKIIRQFIKHKEQNDYAYSG
jgi:hypothetical protein